MEILNKTLTQDGVLLEVNGSEYNIEAVYFANADKLTGDSDEILKVSTPIDFEYNSNELLIHVPDTAVPLIFITIKYINDESTEDYLTISFLNEFSLFKAKTKYLDIFYGCEDCCHHDNCLGKCCGASCCTGNSCSVNGCCQKGHCCNHCDLDHNMINCGYDSGYCKGCEDKNRTLTLLTFMLRYNIFEQLYQSNYTQGMIKAYHDLCRVQNLNKIPFNNINLKPSYYKNPGKLHELFVALNNEIKMNTSVCTVNALKLLMTQDLYSLIFSTAENSGKPEWILEDTVWNMNDEFWFNDKNWKY